MKNFYRRPAVALVLTALSMPSTLAAVAAPAAPTFTSKSDGFSVWLPGKPQIASRETSTPIGKMNVRYYTVATPPLAYVVIPMALPGTLTPQRNKEYFDGVERGFTMSTKAQLVSKKTLNLNGVPGRELVVKTGNGLIRGHFYAVGKKSYQVMAISPQKSSAAQNAQIGKVLGSFRILR